MKPRAVACVYKRVEVRTVNGNAKSFLCERERERKSLEILNQMKQIVDLKH